MQAALELAQSRSKSQRVLIPARQGTADHFHSLARSKDDDPTGMWTLRHAIMQSSSLAR